MTIPNTMRAITIREPGGPEVLELADATVPAPGPGQVLVRVTAAGVNGPDLLQRRGHYPPPPGASPLLGLEISGDVVALGDDVARWQIGDKLCALTNGGGYAEYVAIDADHCIAIPNGVSDIDAAGLPETFFTVYSNVFHGHDVAKGANFLVHGGAGGIGSTAIQLGSAMGLNVLTTVSNSESDGFAKDLGAHHVINYKDADFVEATREHGGADIVLDIVGGDYIARNMKAARHDARIIQLAFNQGSRVDINLMPVMLKRLVFTGSTLRSRPSAFKAAVAKGVETNVWPHFASGQIKPVTHTTMPMAEASKAHQMMEASAHRGKIILTMT